MHGRYIIVSSKNFTAWLKDAKSQITVQAPGRANNVTSIEVTIFAPDMRKADLTNKAESILDLLVECGVIEDDNWFAIPKVILKMGGVDRIRPRAEVEIQCATVPVGALL